MRERQQRLPSLPNVALRNPWALVLAVPLLFIVMLGVFQATEALLDWPETSRERDVATFVALGVALLPLVLAIGSQAFGFLSERGASVEASAAWASFKVDFSRRAEQARTTQQMQMPANITPGNVGDSGSNEVINAVAQASAVPVVTIDLEDGRAWWATRLLALAAGAEHYGRPEALVFVATRSNVAHVYLGWARPQQVRIALLTHYAAYRNPYQTAVALTHQLAMTPPGKEPPLLNLAPPPPAMPGQPAPVLPDAQASWYRNDFDQDPASAFVRILIDRLQAIKAEPAFNEQPAPDLLVSRARLDELAGHCLYTDTIDLEQPVEEQILKALNTPAPWIAAVRDGVFVGLVEVDTVTRSAVRHLIQAARPASEQAANR
jgi:hypothetical protein